MGPEGRKVKAITLTDIEVKGIVAGKRTQIRRALKIQPFRENRVWNVFFPASAGGHVRYSDERALLRGYRAVMLPKCHKPGALLWVREVWGVKAPTNGVQHFAYRVDGYDGPLVDGWQEPAVMPVEASRLTLRVLHTRLHRVSQIDESGITAEGCISRKHFQAQWDLIQEQLSASGRGNTGIFPFKEDPIVVSYTVTPE